MRPAGHRPGQGFTLIELLIVVGILGILAAIAIPVYSKVIERGKLAALSAEAKVVYQAFREYYIDHNAFPAEDVFNKRSFEPLVSEGYLSPGAARSFSAKLLGGEPLTYVAPDIGSPNAELILVLRCEFDPTQIAYILYTSLGGCCPDFKDGVFYWQGGTFATPDEVKP